MDDRTVANELQNGSTQSSLACKSCRKKKLKCDRIIPQCRHCQKASKTCEYPAVAHKPGPRPGTHRRSARNHGLRPNQSQSTDTGDAQSYGTHGYADTPISSNSSNLDNHLHWTSYNIASQQHQASTGSPELHSLPITGLAFSNACKSMQLSLQSCIKVIEVYFESVTTCSIFHQPTFLSKLNSLSSTKEVHALLMSMLAVSIRFMDRSILTPYENTGAVKIAEDAHNLSNECLRECGDDVPTLTLLQSLLLQTFLFAKQGVRGRCWRLTGLCIKMAYELRLHELDIDMTDDNPVDTNERASSDNWIEVEEKRRTWWAIWECDIFTSTIQRLPMGIDGTRIRTCLPSPDDAWFNGKRTRSCYLNTDPNQRWKDLRDSGNTSPTAWFILINSYKWDSLSVTRRLTPPTTFSEGENSRNDVFASSGSKSVITRKQDMLENCLRCALGALPSSLQFDSFLSFERAKGPFPGADRMRDYGKYITCIMSQVTQLFLSRKDLQGGNFIAFPTDLENAKGSQIQQGLLFNQQTETERKRWQRCLVNSNNIASLIRNSSPNHYKYVNPNATTALWMAAATQLAVLTFYHDEIDVDLARSNLDLLTTTIESFARFWDLPKPLVQSLSTLEQHLMAMNARQTGAARDSNGPRSNATYGNDRDNDIGSYDQDQTIAGMADIPGDFNIELSPFDVLQAMDFGAMYNGVENWENLFLDPGFSMAEYAC